MLPSPLAATGLGVALHVASLGLRLDNHAWRILCLWNALLILSIFFHGASHVFSAASFFLLGLFSSTAAWRLLFSPLRRFPGPWAAALSGWYRVLLAVRSNVRLFTEIGALHARYGDVVRVGPRELSLLHPAAVQLIYGARSGCVRGPWYDHAGCADADKQVFLVRDPALHAWRRRIMDRGFSTKALANYEPRVQRAVDALLAALDARMGEEIDVQAWIAYFAFDVMGDVAYGLDFGMLARGEGAVRFAGKSTSIAALHATTRLFGILGPVPWFIRMVLQTGFAGELAAFHQLCHDTMRAKQAMFHGKSDDLPDIASFILQAHQDAADGGGKQQTQLSIMNGSILLIMAGSDTAASALGNALFYLARDRARFLKLRAALDAGAQGYLDAVLNETLRLKPPVCEGPHRETPPEGIMLDGTHIPGNTVVSVPIVALQRDTRFWGPDAAKFVPERWLGPDGVDPANADIPFMPFSKGAYVCPGKNLAFMEMRKVIAGIVTKFDLEFAPGQSEKAFDEGCVDSFTLTNPPLRVVLTKRAA